MRNCVKVFQMFVNVTIRSSSQNKYDERPRKAVKGRQRPRKAVSQKSIGEEHADSVHKAFTANVLFL